MGQYRGKADTPMGGVGIHELLGLVPGEEPPVGEEQGVVDEMIARTDREQGGWHAVQIGVQG